MARDEDVNPVFLFYYCTHLVSFCEDDILPFLPIYLIIFVDNYLAKYDKKQAKVTSLPAPGRNLPLATGNATRR